MKIRIIGVSIFVFAVIGGFVPAFAPSDQEPDISTGGSTAPQADVPVLPRAANEGTGQVQAAPADPSVGRDSTAMPSRGIPVPRRSGTSDDTAIPQELEEVTSDSVALEGSVSEAPPDSVALEGSVSETPPDSVALEGSVSETPPDSVALEGSVSETLPDSVALEGSPSEMPPDPVLPTESEVSEQLDVPKEYEDVEALVLRDDFGLMAAWRAWAAGDTVTIRPLVFAPSWHPTEDPLLLRIVRRFFSRRFIREWLDLRPEFFLSSDSITVVVDARVDSLVEEGEVAPGVFFRPSLSGGVRYLPPTLRSLEKRDKRSKDYSVDLADARITRQLLYDATPLFPRVSESYATYLFRLTRISSRSLWKREIKQSLREITARGGRAGLVRFSLPFEMPKTIKSIFGEGKPNLMVSGSERITFGGRSQWLPHRPTYELRGKKSKFPQLEMKQDLTIRLKGSIGDKLDVDVDQSSQAATSLANRIKIHYHGYEDEIIRRVDLGNTSLRLPGTEYVSYGGSHTGLFGINTEAQFGPLTLNLILSKQEGQAATKSTNIRSERQTKTIYDYEYIRNRFFFLDDPTEDAYPDPYDPAFVVKMRQSSVRLWLDDGDGRTQEEFAMNPGIAVLDLRAAARTATDTVFTDTLYFELLEYEKDYWLWIDERFEGEDMEVHPYIVMNRYLDENSTLAVTYHDEGLGVNVGGYDENDLLHTKMIRPSNDPGGQALKEDLTEGPWGRTNRLMLKNVYSLHPSGADWSGQGLPENTILEEGFELSIHYRGTIEGAEDPDEIDGVKLIRYLGLDYFQQSDIGYVEGQDGKVDVHPWISLGNGLIYFPDLQPFAPMDSTSENDTFHLRGRPLSAQPWDVLPEEYWNRGIYKRRSCVRERVSPGSDPEWKSLFYIEVTYRTPVSELQIPAWDIIEGSEVITAGGQRLTKDRDYRINYQTGVIQILDPASIGEEQEINVTYKRAEAFGTASKTLLGGAVFYQPEDSKLRLSSSWLYERTSSPDRRPRLGSEPTRTAVGEIATSYSTESMALTRLLDRLPMLQVRQPSRISVEAGMGISFPNPNRRNDLYIDDFEGVADDLVVRLNRFAWQPCSIPLAAPGQDDESRAARRGELWWYTPRRAVQQGDINPTLDYQEANDNRHQLIELQLFPYPSPDTLVTDSWEAEESWGGVIQGLSRSSLDLSRARFLDIWINDFDAFDAPDASSDSWRQGTIYVEIGRMSEDALWERRPVDCASLEVIGDPIHPPNGKLDTEDQNFDGELDLSDTYNEDTGLDGILNEPGDSSHDDFEYEGDPDTDYNTDPELCEIYSRINGTERNGRLDAEDLDGDTSPDFTNSYFQFKIDLDDSTFVETDVRRDYLDQDVNWVIEANNAWRRIRIPLSHAYVDSFVNNPSWADIKHLRFWFTGMQERRRIQIGAIEVRSNRWAAEAIQDSSGAQVPADELAEMEEDFFPGVINNKENSDTYVPPFMEHRDRRQNEIREKEQSLTLEMRNFQPGHSGRVYMPFLRDQDYMGYEFIEFWLNSTVPSGQHADFFIRFCKDANIDSTHYYEYRVPVPKMAAGDRSGSWKQVKIRLTDLSDLKRLAVYDTTVSEIVVWDSLPDGSRILMAGRPYLTKIRRITLGVENTDTTATQEVIKDASIWIDELRLTHVFKDTDTAYRVQVRTELSDFGKFDLSLKRVGDDFVSISGGGFRRRKEVEQALSTSLGMPLDRFTPRRFGLRMPFNFSYTKSTRIPKYRTNDDILVGEHPTDRDKTESVNRNTSLKLSRRKSKSGLLKYTLDAISLSGSYKDSYTNSPLNRDSNRSASYSIGYSTSLGTFGDLRPYRNWQVRLLPTNISVSLGRGRREQIRYRRKNANLYQPFILDDSRTTRSGGLNFSTGLRPVQAISYNFKQSRNLMLVRPAKWLGGLNIGSEISRDEDLGFTHTLRALKGWIEPRLSWKGTFKGKFNQQQSGAGGNLVRSNNLTNSRTFSISGDIPLRKLLDKLAQVGRGSSKGKAKQPQEAEDRQDERAREREGSHPVPGTRGQGTERSEQRSSRSGGGSIFGKWLVLTRTTGNFSRGERSTFSLTRGEPSLAYQLGLSMDPQVIFLPSGRESESKTNNLGIDFDLRVLRGVAVSGKYALRTSESMSSGTRTGSTENRWPELDIRWGDLAKKMKLRSVFKHLKATTRFSRKTKSSTLEGKTTKREVASQWSPLLDLNSTLQNGMAVTFRVDYNSIHSEDLGGWRRESDRKTTRVILSAKKSLNITREITVPLTNTKERVTTRLDLGLSVKLDKSRGVSQEAGRKPLLLGDTRKFDFSLNGSYQFSKTVSGKLVISFGENADHKNKTKTARYVGMSISAGFSF